jgi:hypothetical protein
MNNINVDNNKNNLFQNNINLIWLFVYIGIGLAISFVVPFPISFVVVLLVLALLNLYRTDRTLKKHGRGGIKELYKSMSSSVANRTSGLGAEGFVHNPIKFYCINCGYEHKNDACPKCGSKAVKVG